MFKSVKFNIFEEGLEELVYGKDLGAKLKKQTATEKFAKKTVQITKEIILKPLAFQPLKQNFKTL